MQSTISKMPKMSVCVESEHEFGRSTVSEFAQSQMQCRARRAPCRARPLLSRIQNDPNAYASMRMQSPKPCFRKYAMRCDFRSRTLSSRPSSQCGWNTPDCSASAQLQQLNWLLPVHSSHSPKASSTMQRTPRRKSGSTSLRFGGAHKAHALPQLTRQSTLALCVQPLLLPPSLPLEPLFVGARARPPCRARIGGRLM